MRLTLSPAVERALAVAQGLARAAGGDQVGPGHLLVALLREEDGHAAALAESAGVDLGLFRGAKEAEGEPLPLSRDLDTALHDARDLAAELSFERIVTGEAAFLALARLPDLAELLRGAGLIEARLTRPEPKPLPALSEGIHLEDVTERADTARLLDAAANRAREALRVLEDHARFVLDDALLCESLKGLRHDLTRALLEHGPPGLLEMRDTLGDVGTSVQAEGEYRRDSLRDVVLAAGKRLGESLRSLEEYGKLIGPQLGERVEALRYRFYTVEKALSLVGKAQRALRDARLYVLLSGASCVASLEWTIEQAAEGGAAIVQLREKELTDREWLRRAADVRRWTRRAGVLFIVNDRPDIARLVEADGVHLGQDDLPVREARRLLGPDALIGVSTHEPEQVNRAVLDGASYLGVGPTFPSGTKKFDHFPGLDFVRQATTMTAIPMFVLGGIDESNVRSVAQAGATRVAVGQAVAAADDPRAAAAALLEGLRADEP
jgi:thiamine-phosphate pyrophosphorylase